MRPRRLGRSQGAGRRHGAEPGADLHDQRGVRAAAERRGPARHHPAVGDAVQRHAAAITRCAKAASSRCSAGAASRCRRSSGVDCALWDILGKSLGQPVWRLLGGRRAEKLPAYASGGWAGPDKIGEQLLGYVEAGGFGAVKMRVGIIDGDPRHSARPRQGGARGARPRNRADVRRARHAVGGRGEALLPPRRGLQPDVVRGAGHRRRQGRPGAGARRHRHPDRRRARASSPATISAISRCWARSTSCSPIWRSAAASPRRCASRPSPAPST